ncbi:MAG: c-type cytochrome biogenesis protein CcmI [Gammaproteobacteria bacterium]|nr:c-type cytochrome biogenesis protein CcmI [Gammaproteobacteria bacterium]
MTLFWTLLVVLVAVALAIVLPPLLRRRTVSIDANNLNVALARERLRELENESADDALDPAQLDAARDELKRELLLDVERSEGEQQALSGQRDVFGMLGVVVGVPLLAFALYGLLGDQNAVRGVPVAPSAGGHEDTSIAAMIERVEARLQQNPDDATGWLMLARSYSFAQRWDDAERAFARARDLAPRNPDVLVEYAGVLGRKMNGVLTGQPEELLRTALQAQPRHMNGMFLMGHVHFQAGRYNDALELWGQVAGQLEPGSADLQQLQQYITEARSQLGLPAETVPAAAAAAPGKSIRVSVDLDPTFASAVAPGDTLFVYARATEGPRMPLAITRVTASRLPLTVTLDESMAMMPQMTLANFEQVTVEARISKTGSATPQSGDIRGTRSPVRPGTDEMVEILIDSRVP